MPAHDAYFGAGMGIIVPPGANPTGIRLATLRNVSVKFSTEYKDLEGEDDVAIDSGVASRKCAITAQTAEWRLEALVAFFAGTLTAGRTIPVKDEGFTIPSTPFQVTVANPTGFVDGTVRNLTTGRFMTRVASAPATGQYSVSVGGVYTFAAADTGNSVLISYFYTSATGAQVDVLARPSAIATLPKLYVGNSNSAGKDVLWEFPKVKLPEIGYSFQNRDWASHDVSLEAIAEVVGSTKRFFKAYQNV